MGHLTQKEMARELSAPDLLRSAARLIERALIQLDMRESPCLECGTKLFAKFEHAKVYQSFSETPDKLKGAAEKLDQMPGGFKSITEGRR